MLKFNLVSGTLWIGSHVSLFLPLWRQYGFQCGRGENWLLMFIISSICRLAIMPMKAGFHLVFTFILNCSYFLVLKVTTLSSVIAMFLSTSIRIPLSKTISATKQKWKSGTNLAIWSYGRNGLHRTTLHIQNFCRELICPTQVPSSQFHVYFVILFVSHKFQ